MSFLGDDSGVSSGGGGGDPAVLAVGPARKPLTYTRDELMRLRNSPLVKRNLENAFAGCEALALWVWIIQDVVIRLFLKVAKFVTLFRSF